jgi:arginine/serine-rich splicing factor 2
MSSSSSSRKPDVASLHSVMVSNLPFDVRPDDLYRLFDRYGEVADVYIPRRNGRPGSYCFVRYRRLSEAEDALRADGKDLLGVRINVQFAKFGKSGNFFQNLGEI